MTPLNSIINLVHTISSSTDRSTDTIKDKINDIVKKYLLNPIDVFNSFGMEKFKVQYGSISNEVKNQLLKEIEEVASGQNAAKKAKKYPQELDSFSCLSDDVLLHIFQFLAKGDVFSIFQVNKQFARIAQDPYIVLPYLERCINDLDFQTLTNLFSRYGENIKSLNLIIDKRFKNCSEALTLVSLCPNLTSLNLCIKNKYPNINVEAYEDEYKANFDQLDEYYYEFKKLSSENIRCLGSLKELKKLTLYKLRFNFTVTQFDNIFLKLESLELLDCEFNDREIVSFVGRMINLTSLEITSRTDELGDQPNAGSFIKNCTENGIIELAKSIKNLKSLAIHESNLTPLSLQALIQSNPGLISLSITKSKQKNFQWIKNINPFPSLHLLKLRIFPNHQPQDPENDAVFMSIAPKLHNLKSLSFSDSSISKGCLKYLAPYLNELLSLELINCKHVDDDALQVMSPYLKKLTHLKISSESKVTQKSLMSIIKNLPSLTSISLNFLKISTNQIIEIAPHFRNITTLHLTGVNSLIEEYIDDCLLEIAPYLENVEYLNLSYCKISEKSHQALSLLPKLQSLCLEKTHITFPDEESNFKLYSYIQKLTTLSLVNCSMLTNKCLRQISENSQNLEILDLSCTEIGIDGLKPILSTSKKLKFLSIKKSNGINYRDLLEIAPYFKKIKISFSREREIQETNEPLFKFEDLKAIEPLLRYLDELDMNFAMTQQQLIDITPSLRGIPYLVFKNPSSLSEEFLELLMK